MKHELLGGPSHIYTRFRRVSQDKLVNVFWLSKSDYDSPHNGGIA